jgi:hypothetical protein
LKNNPNKKNIQILKKTKMKKKNNLMNNLH